MQDKLKVIFSNSRFYALLLLVLLAVGAGSYTVLSRQSQPDTTADLTPTEAVSTPVQQLPASNTADIPAADPEPAIQETSSEPIVPEKPQIQVVMPEKLVNDTSVAAEGSRLVTEPLQGDIVATFAADTLMYNETLGDWRTHEAIDIAAETGTAVLAACAGTVASVDTDLLMGTTVVIDHENGYQTTYANLQTNPDAAAGDKVSVGQVIGAVGDTAAAESVQGPHLHFAVTQNGTPVDPAEFLR